jgi:hypothetical protein
MHDDLEDYGEEKEENDKNYIKKVKNPLYLLK